jgi:hypothetical protein
VQNEHEEVPRVLRNKFMYCTVEKLAGLNYTKAQARTKHAITSQLSNGMKLIMTARGGILTMMIERKAPKHEDE